MVDPLPDLAPVMLTGLRWDQARSALDAIDCAARREHWCSPVVILLDGKPVIDDDGEIKPFTFMPGDRRFADWMLVPRTDDDGKDIPPTYRSALSQPVEAQ